MIRKIFCIYDIKAQIFSIPYQSKTEDEAIRLFFEVVNDDTTAMGRCPTNYELFEIGSFDNISAELLSIKPNRIAKVDFKGSTHRH